MTTITLDTVMKYFDEESEQVFEELAKMDLHHATSIALGILVLRAHSLSNKKSLGDFIEESYKDDQDYATAMTAVTIAIDAAKLFSKRRLEGITFDSTNQSKEIVN